MVLKKRDMSDCSKSYATEQGRVSIPHQPVSCLILLILKQIMSMKKYLCIFSHYVEVIGYTIIVMWSCDLNCKCNNLRYV